MTQCNQPCSLINLFYHYLKQIVLKNSAHPPIMKGTSWTQAAPFKEEKFCRTPSESIGNNYTPEARDLKIKELYKRKAPPFIRGMSRHVVFC